MSESLNHAATLALNSWAGRSEYAIRVIDETRTTYVFEALTEIPMPSGRRLKAGEHGRAPKTAIRLKASA